jgi:UDP-glucose:(heptosyl)LPS alpha-1,3-glucosyltransferase
MPGLDVYYAADPCYQEKARNTYQPKFGPLYYLTPRFRQYVAMEEAVFTPKVQTQILQLSAYQQQAFVRYYDTPRERFHLLPPGIRLDRIPHASHAPARRQLRRELSLSDSHLLLVMVGSRAKGKGLDRSLRALAALPVDLRQRTWMIVLGENKSKPFLRLAARLGIGGKLLMLGGREDIPRYLLGADQFIHPAYSENTGTVILEAMACGLPVLATDVCGYASHVVDAQAGEIIPSPFDQEALNRTLASMLTSPLRPAWARNGISYVKSLDLGRRWHMAATIIESTKKGKTCDR